MPYFENHVKSVDRPPADSPIVPQKDDQKDLKDSFFQVYDNDENNAHNTELGKVSQYYGVVVEDDYMPQGYFQMEPEKAGQSEIELMDKQEV